MPQKGRAIFPPNPRSFECCDRRSGNCSVVRSTAAEDFSRGELRGFGPLGIISILATGNIIVGKWIVPPIGAALVLVWARASGTPSRDIGYARHALEVHL